MSVLWVGDVAVVCATAAVVVLGLFCCVWCIMECGLRFECVGSIKSSTNNNSVERI